MAPQTDEQTDNRKRAWLAAFEEQGTVVAACKAASVGRSTTYEWRQKDEAFALAWADIEEATTEAMEREAYRRAVEGVSEPLVSAGRLVTNTQKYSDTLLIFMLKARRPERYRDNVKVEHSGTVTFADLAAIIES
jgi:transposase-like protein